MQTLQPHMSRKSTFFTSLEMEVSNGHLNMTQKRSQSHHRGPRMLYSQANQPPLLISHQRILLFLKVKNSLKDNGFQDADDIKKT